MELKIVQTVFISKEKDKLKILKKIKLPKIIISSEIIAGIVFMK